MEKYILYLLLIVFAVAQVAWAGFLNIWGITFPIILLYLWFIRKRVSFNHLVVMAFVAGMIIDLLSSIVLGMYTFSLLVAVGSITVTERRTLYHEFVTALLSLIVGVFVFVSLLQYLTNQLGSL